MNKSSFTFLPKYRVIEKFIYIAEHKIVSHVLPYLKQISRSKCKWYV